MMLSTISPKGQITMPHRLCERLGLLPSMPVEIFETPEGRLVILLPRGETQGQRALDLLRRARTNVMTAEKILALTRGRDEDEGKPEQ